MEQIAKKEMVKHVYTYLLVALLLGFAVNMRAQSSCPDSLEIGDTINSYLGNYKTEDWGVNKKFKLEKLDIDSLNKSIRLYFNESFAQQPFSQGKVDSIYSDIKGILPQKYNKFNLIILAQDTPIEQLIAYEKTDPQTQTPLTWEGIKYDGAPWVRNISLPENTQNRILSNRHIAIWQSHGRYFDAKSGNWYWQRPLLWCTTEDLLTQSFVVPFIVPMLENSGAYVYMPRERDWQDKEVVVDNDDTIPAGIYIENNGKYCWQNASIGFANNTTKLKDRENPFIKGTTRRVQALQGTDNLSRITWMPEIPKEGQYAVYISYKSDSTSIADAHYTVEHQGIKTDFLINQKIGGSTWVYLGTFDFGKDKGPENCVYLTNQSASDGYVYADGVRFGGGMGNVTRGNEATTSGLPRYLEGARYNLQWSGIPDSVYCHFDGKDDYKDDYTSRAYAVNYLSGGSVFNPSNKGLNVPIELSMAVHSDAGYTKDDRVIGTLGIFTSDRNGAKTFPTGISRMSTRTLCDIMMQQIYSDITAKYGKWNRRELYNRNYAETRIPLVPAIIIETLSHQNFADTKLAHDPTFKFTLGRAIYKSIVRYNTFMHNEEKAIIQPLPIKNISAIANSKESTITLNWEAQKDELEPTATPKGYVVYQSIDDNGFDNGTYVTDTKFVVSNALSNRLYRFKVSAWNEGGFSLESEEVCARCGKNKSENILIVNCFQRLAAPLSFETKDSCGFDLLSDPGVAYMKTPEYSGPQLGFNKSQIGNESKDGLGYSSASYVGQIMGGNTFNYPTLHAKALMKHNDFTCSISSCSRGALESEAVDFSPYKLIDIIMGAQKDDGYSPNKYKTFTKRLKEILTIHTNRKGALLISGAYIGSDMADSTDMEFTSNVLHYKYANTNSADSIMQIHLKHREVAQLNMRPNEDVYHVRHTDELTATDNAKESMAYDSDLRHATVYYTKKYKSTCIGFPLELISDKETRDELIYREIKKLIK